MSTINFVEQKIPNNNLVAPRSEQPQQKPEWPGHASSKFNGNKAHIPEPIVDNNQAHPIFSFGGKQHFQEKNDSQKQWKPSLKTDIHPIHKEPRQQGVKFTGFVPLPVKGQPERRHVQEQFKSLNGPTLDNQNFCMRPFENANKPTNKEFSQEQIMTQKQRIKTIYEQRNGLPMASLGDKIYKNPDYSTDFFKDGGLIAGSTNQMKMKSGGNGKAIDFYSGLKLDQGPLNPNRKTWTQAVKEQQLNEELEAVSSLKDWERGTLKEADPKYKVDDDTDDENQAAKKLKEQQQAQPPPPAPEKPKGK